MLNTADEDDERPAKTGSQARNLQPRAVDGGGDELAAGQVSGGDDEDDIPRYRIEITTTLTAASLVPSKEGKPGPAFADVWEELVWRGVSGL